MKSCKGTDFSKRVEATLSAHKLLSPGQEVTVALSGGSDSVALLRVLLALGYKVQAAHFNFMLRGVESDRDELFVRDLCRRLNVPLRVRREDASAFSRLHGVSIEMAAREMRYTFFAEISSENIPMAVAHHLDDNIETVLLNMLRGTGLKGLSGMQYQKTMRFGGRCVNVIRPMLDVSRSDITEYLASLRQPFVTDSSNLRADVKRNKIRLRVLPEFEAVNPAFRDTFRENILRLRETYKMYEASVQSYLKEIRSNRYGDRILMKSSLEHCPSRETVIYEWLSQYGFSTSQTGDILAFSSDKSRRFYSDGIPGNADVCGYVLLEDKVHYALCRLEKPEDCPPASLPERGVLEYHGITIHSERITFPPDAQTLRDPHRAFIDRDRIKGTLEVRRVRKGDRFTPFGMKGTKLVSDYLKEQKMPEEERMRQTAIVAEDGMIVWLTGLRLSDKASVSKDSSHILSLSVDLPGE